MRTALECIPCFVRQAMEAARFVTDDFSVHEQVLRDVLRWTAEMDLSECPPRVGQRIHRRLRELTGAADPYRGPKDRFNRLAMEMLPDLEEKIRQSPDPFEMSLRLAIAGNVIDLGIDGGLTESDARHAVERALDEPFRGDIAAFRGAANAAGKILYLADNAGEIVFDRLLVERLPRGRVTVGVRGSAVLTGATRADAEVAGLPRFAEVIGKGSDAPGTILDDCSEAFRRRFAEADLIVAKGQGNFETLSDEPGNLYFLFKAKCPVIAGHAGLPVGTHAAMQRQAAGV
jgi:hypothetical protein